MKALITKSNDFVDRVTAVTFGSLRMPDPVIEHAPPGSRPSERNRTVLRSE
jgi:hypothetical protein